MAISSELQGHVDELKRLANHHSEQIKHQTESFVRLTRSLSEKEVEVRSIISKENEKNQQNRIAESTKLMANIEEVRTFLEEKLDVILKILIILGDLQRGQSQTLEAINAQVERYQMTLIEIHASIEDCTASTAKMVATVENMRNEARDPKMMQGTENWLGQFCRQLIASGITSAMTAGVIMIATRSEGGHTADDRNVFERPRSHQTVPPISLSSEDAVPATWAWICCHCHASNILVLFPRCPICDHVRDSGCKTFERT